ncbi:MAG: hypothetical protein IKO93_00445, partial [Lentisphaeria bacterium]|nr:hypothetical protein [Lentisphaeria bacterium]
LVLALSRQYIPLGGERARTKPVRKETSSKMSFFGLEKDRFQAQKSTCINLLKMWRFMMCNDAFQVKLKGDENYRKISIS